jgi:hypothetical protein
MYDDDEELGCNWPKFYKMWILVFAASFVCIFIFRIGWFLKELAMIVFMVFAAVVYCVLDHDFERIEKRRIKK